METPFLDQLIDEHQNHIESVEASSYAGIQETRKQLAELEAIKAIIVTHCCMGEAEQLLCSCDNSNGFKEMEDGRETCSKCKKPY